MTVEKALNERSSQDRVLALWDGLFADKIAELPEDLQLLNEIDLEKRFTPRPVDYFLRKRFWQVSNAALAAGRTSVQTNEIYEGQCSKQCFYRMIQNPHRLAWILIPISTHADVIEEGFYIALKRVRDDLLTMPMNEKTAPIILRALEYLTNRHLGAVPVKNLNFNANISTQPTDNAMEQNQLEAKYEELKAKISSRAKDVTPIDPVDE